MDGRCDGLDDVGGREWMKFEVSKLKWSTGDVKLRDGGYWD